MHSRYLKLGVMVHPAHSSRRQCGFIWAVRGLQGLKYQIYCLKMTLLPVSDRDGGGQSQLPFLLDQCRQIHADMQDYPSQKHKTKGVDYLKNFIRGLLFYHLSRYAAAQLLPKNRPSGWEASLSSKWYFPVRRPPAEEKQRKDSS